MPGTDAQRKPVDAGLISRVTQGVRYMLSGKAPDQWFGPSQPVEPQAQQQALGRQFDYPVGYNLRFVPRSDESVSFAQLRGLADACDLVRLAIETRKDQLCRMQWTVRPRDQSKSSEEDPRCQAIQDALQFPDREHDWQQWLRMVLEDLFVLDAPTIYPRLTKGGGVYSLDVIDGSTIKRVLSEDGRTPEPPQPAYQQYLKGVPAVDYHRDELLYLPRNPRSNRIYGYSPVEQIIMTVNISIRRTLTQLQYYTEGNIPDAIYSTPAEWNPDQIRMFQEYWDAMLEGNTAARRHAKFVPGGVKVDQTRDPTLKDEYDEWLARVICYAFSLPPTAFAKQQNRATAQTAQDTAQEEGLAPSLMWVQSLMNQLIGRWWAFPDLMFDWQEEEAQDPLQQAQINQIYVTTKVVTPNEVRGQLGLEPLTGAQQEELNPPPPEPEGGEPDGEDPPKPESEKAVKFVRKKKASSPSIRTGVLSPRRSGRFIRY